VDTWGPGELEGLSLRNFFDTKSSQEKGVARLMAKPKKPESKPPKYTDLSGSALLSNSSHYFAKRISKKGRLPKRLLIVGSPSTAPSLVQAKAQGVWQWFIEKYL
jgi:hypothetical protein